MRGEAKDSARDLLSVRRVDWQMKVKIYFEYSQHEMSRVLRSCDEHGA